jgi:endonuclease/exonuclease/phosphatase family metal-dependent hydrolase
VTTTVHRRHACAAVVAAVLAASTACAAGADDRRGPQVTVMTRNLYLGTGLDDLVGVSSEAELVAAVDAAWANVVANDFPARAGALAEEIAAARPDVLGLQEVTLWRDQTPGDLGTHPAPNAGHVVLDQLAVLRSALSARGTPYTAVATSTNADLEVARHGTDGDLVDVRITDRDVLLVRSDLADRSGNPDHGHFTDVRELPSWPRAISNVRGWASVDYSPDGGTTVRILTTHLEVSGPRAGRIQERQAAEAVRLVAASPHPVIVLGDLNSPADGSATDTHARLTEVLDDAWASARPGEPGSTCCQTELLDDAVGRADVRLDLVLVPQGWPVAGAARTGATPFRSAPAPLWASDHAGLVVRLTVPGGADGGSR